MRLPRESRIVRWAFLGERVPGRSSLCSMFWRTVLLTPVFKIAVPLAAVLFLLSRFWFYPKPAFSIAGFVVVMAAAFAFADWLDERQKMRPHKDDPTPSVIRDGFTAIKGKVCPLIDLN